MVQTSEFIWNPIEISILFNFRCKFLNYTSLDISLFDQLFESKESEPAFIQYKSVEKDHFETFCSYLCYVTLAIGLKKCVSLHISIRLL